MKMIIFCAMFLIGISSAPASAVVIEHIGSSNPSAEGWTILPSADVQSGGTETTASGSHDFWHIEHPAASGARSTVEYMLSSAQLNTDWIFQARVRVIDSPLVPLQDTPITAVGVRDGKQWAFSLGNDVVGIARDYDPMIYFTTKDTRSDYHLYEIRFHRNGPTPEDDSADFYYDGSLLFSSVPRNVLAVAPASVTLWGPTSGFAIASDANYEYVSFVPEPSSFAFCALLPLSLCRRKRKLQVSGS